MSIRPSCTPAGRSQIVPRSERVESVTPSSRRVTTDRLPRTSTQISASGCGLFQVTVPLWPRSSAVRFDQPRVADEASSPAPPYLFKPRLPDGVGRDADSSLLPDGFTGTLPLLTSLALNSRQLGTSMWLA